MHSLQTHHMTEAFWCVCVVCVVWVCVQCVCVCMCVCTNVTQNTSLLSGNGLECNWPGRILTSASHTCILIVPTVMEVESVVWTVGDVRPQLPALHIVQHNGTTALTKVGPMELLCSRGQESQLSTHHLQTKVYTRAGYSCLQNCLSLSIKITPASDVSMKHVQVLWRGPKISPQYISCWLLPLTCSTPANTCIHCQMFVLSHLPKSSIKSSTLSLTNSLDWFRP